MMKPLCFAVAGALLWSSAARAEISTAERSRLQSAAAVVTELRRASDKDIPESLWNNAECVIVMPSVKKAALGIGGEFGKGAMSCRNDHGWGAPIFMELAKGSFGLQLGGQAADLVLLVMNRQGIDRMLDDKVTLGTDASIAAGPVGRAGQAATDLQLTAQVLSYSRAKGLFAGIDLSGGVLRSDKDANHDAYGPAFSPKETLASSHVQAPELRAFIGTLGSGHRE
jgi:lipid-binding SYLF domain-containing protein